MKLEIEEWSNSPQAPDAPSRMWWVMDAADNNGDGQPVEVGRIWSPGATGTKHHFRLTDGANDLEAEDAQQIADILKDLDKKRADHVANKQSPCTS